MDEEKPPNCFTNESKCLPYDKKCQKCRYLWACACLIVYRREKRQKMKKNEEK